MEFINKFKLKERNSGTSNSCWRFVNHNVPVREILRFIPCSNDVNHSKKHAFTVLLLLLKYKNEMMVERNLKKTQAR